ncbi:uncharacterized protein [Syngnathus scovelli]|uniref:uncharacterized protein isoform X2 n=1 Tax=Syngnathus scovelli TaxID=161590 RepID=UPI00210F5A6A|nr:brevican core protein-like isoform X2 [Syngnathus scovelli]
MSLLVVATLLLILVLCWTCNAYTYCPYAWKNHKNNCFRKYEYIETWKAAENGCKGASGHLASIWHIKEMEFTESEYPYEDLWIGLSRKNKTDQWKWSDGSIYYPEHWNTFPARNDTKFPQCIAMDARTSKWKIHSCESKKYYICKMTLDDPTCSCLLGVLANPNGSIRAAFNDGLGVNRSVVIRGQANSTAERLIVKLLLGKEDNVTALQLNFHFGNKSIVLNSQADKNTAQQTVNVSQAHQFGPGLNFKIVIQCGNKTFNMNLDDNVQLGLEHQLRNLQRIKWLEVWHVLLSSVQLM